MRKPVWMFSLTHLLDGRIWLRNLGIGYYCPKIYRLRILMLIFLWVLGLFLGLYIAAKVEPLIYSQMYVCGYTSVSIAGLLSVMLLPFVLSLLAIRFRVIWAIFFFAFLKSFLYGYCRSAFVFAYADAGWLMNFLCFFSDSAVTVALLMYWSSCLKRPGRWNLRQYGIFSFASLMICLFDYYYIVPIWSVVIA